MFDPFLERESEREAMRRIVGGPTSKIDALVALVKRADADSLLAQLEAARAACDDRPDISPGDADLLGRSSAEIAVLAANDSTVGPRLTAAHAALGAHAAKIRAVRS